MCCVHAVLLNRVRASVSDALLLCLLQLLAGMALAQRDVQRTDGHDTLSMQDDVLKGIPHRSDSHTLPFPGHTRVLAYSADVLARAGGHHNETADQAHDQVQVSALRFWKAGVRRLRLACIVQV